MFNRFFDKIIIIFIILGLNFKFASLKNNQYIVFQFLNNENMDLETDDLSYINKIFYLSPLHYIYDIGYRIYDVEYYQNVFNRIKLRYRKIKKYKDSKKYDKSLNILNKNLSKLKETILQKNLFMNIGKPLPIFSLDTIKYNQLDLKQFYIDNGYLDTFIKTKITRDKSYYYVNHDVNSRDKYTINKYYYKENDNKTINNFILSILDHNLIKNEIFYNKELIVNERNRIFYELHKNGFLNIKKNDIIFFVYKNRKKQSVDIELIINNSSKQKNIKYNNIIVQIIDKDEADIENQKNIQYKDLSISYNKKLRINKKILFNKIKYRIGDGYDIKKLNKTKDIFYRTEIFRNILVENYISETDDNLINSKIMLYPQDIFNNHNEFFVELDKKNKSKTVIGFHNQHTVKNLFWQLETIKLQSGVNCNFYKYLFNDKVNILYNFYFTLNASIKFPYFTLFPVPYINYQSDVDTSLSFEFYQDLYKESKKKHKKNNTKSIFLHLNYDIFFDNFKINIGLYPIYKEYKIYGSYLSMAFNMNKLKKNIFTYDIHNEIGYSYDKNKDYRFCYYYKFLSDFTYKYLLFSRDKVVSRLKIGFIKIFVDKSLNKTSNHKIYDNAYFNIGGFNSLRGYYYGSLGPGKYNEKNNVKKGEILLLLNLEYRHLIKKFLEMAFFIDTGNIWNQTTKYKEAHFNINNLLKEIAVAIGTGIRYIFNQNIILRFDIGYPIYDVRDENVFKKQLCWYFDIGYPF